MNLDFILFSAPKIKYKSVDFLGETIFIPCYAPIAHRDPTKNNNILSSFANCYRANKTTEVYFSIENALNEQMGEPVKI